MCGTVSSLTNHYMKKIILPISFLILSIVGVSFSLYVSMSSCQWHWFQRSGSLLVICGVYLSARSIFRKGIIDAIHSESHIDYGHIVPTEEEIIEKKLRGWDIRFAYVGAIIALIGTLISAYGDLFGRL